MPGVTHCLDWCRAKAMCCVLLWTFGISGNITHKYWKLIWLHWFSGIPNGLVGWTFNCLFVDVVEKRQCFRASSTFSFLIQQTMFTSALCDVSVSLKYFISKFIDNNTNNKNLNPLFVLFLIPKCTFNLYFKLACVSWNNVNKSTFVVNLHTIGISFINECSSNKWPIDGARCS